MLLIDWLSARFPNAKRHTLRDMVRSKRILINAQPARSLKQPVQDTDHIRVGPRVQAPAASIHPLKVIHEDPDLLVVLKPAGLLTSTTAREKRRTAVGILREYMAKREPQARVGIIHRLDRDASGLLVFSKNNEAFRHLKFQFMKHTVDRIYTAIVHGKPTPKSGQIQSRLVQRADGVVHSTVQDDKGELAISEYQTLRHIGRTSLLKIKLHTGKKHQIRVHLSERGLPIVGDPVYGPDKHPETRLLLAATGLAFNHPRTNHRLTFEIPPPPDIQAAIGSPNA